MFECDNILKVVRKYYRNFLDCNLVAVPNDDARHEKKEGAMYKYGDLIQIAKVGDSNIKTYKKMLCTRSIKEKVSKIDNLTRDVRYKDRESDKDQFDSIEDNANPRGGMSFWRGKDYIGNSDGVGKYSNLQRRARIESSDATIDSHGESGQSDAKPSGGMSFWRGKDFSKEKSYSFDIQGRKQRHIGVMPFLKGSGFISDELRGRRPSGGMRFWRGRDTIYIKKECRNDTFQCRKEINGNKKRCFKRNNPGRNKVRSGKMQLHSDHDSVRADKEFAKPNGGMQFWRGKDFSYKKE